MVDYPTVANGTIDWYFPESGQGMDASINDIVSHMPGVKDAVKLKAHSMASEAWIQLLWHNRTGAARVEVGRHPNAGARTPDWYVYLKDADPGGEGIGDEKGNKFDRSAMSIEFGWFPKGAKKKVPGLHILGTVMKRAARKYRGPR